MPRPRKQVPSYRLHRQSGQAVVTVYSNGGRKDVLLGRYGSPESKDEYARVLAQLRNTSSVDTTAPPPFAASADWRWASDHSM